MFDVKSLPSWQLGYIAGIIDGEGCLYIYKAAKTMCLKPGVYVGMTDSACINALFNVTGIGNVGTHHKEGSHRKRIHTWYVRGKLEIYLLLKAICPYLIVKRKRAELLLKFVERRLQDYAQDSYDMQLCSELTALNK